jgi:hypothetical protein
MEIYTIFDGIYFVASEGRRTGGKANPPYGRICPPRRDSEHLKYLNQLDWDAIQANQWSGVQDKKQAEFLIEGRFPWEMVEGIGVYSSEWVNRANDIAINEKHKPQIKAIREWYY